MTDETGYDPQATDAATDDLSLDTLRAVVELQRTELRRLLREQGRLNDRIDALLQLQEREQVLRQQVQAALDRLTAAQLNTRRDAERLPPQPDGDGSELDDLRHRLERTEGRFSELQGAVGKLIAHIEGRNTGVPPQGGGFVRVFAPG